MLYLIGLGLDEKDLSIKAKEILEKVDEIYAEGYTVKLPYIPKNCKILPRNYVESDFLINLAKEKDVALLCGGDCLYATTHISLIKECIEQNIPYKIIHAPSIINAISEVGLSMYKFGRTITLAGKYESDKEKLEKNKSIGLHTLILVDPKMGFKEALDVLQYFGLEKIVVCEKLGKDDRKIFYANIDKLRDLSIEHPFCFIAPGSLHFFEEEMLDLWKI